MLTFNDDRVIRRLATEFIPVSANTQDLQWRPSPAQGFFMGVVARTLAEGLSPSLAKQIEENFGDAQGLYILGPDGTPYGSVNDHDPADILRFMNQGLRRWRDHRPHGVTIRDDEVAAAWAATPPPGSAVVRVYSRIRPLPVDIWGLNRGIGRDFLWIYPEDIAALIGASGGLGLPRTDVQLPEALVGRILRFHLVDDVRGTPMMWGANDVNEVDVHAHVAKQSGTVRTVAFSADFAMHRAHLPPIHRVPRPDQAYAGRIEGEIDVDVVTARVLRFRAFGEGSASGAGPGTPYPPPGQFRLIIAMVEAKPDDPAARTIPPEAVATDRDDHAYHAATLARPRSAIVNKHVDDRRVPR